VNILPKIKSKIIQQVKGAGKFEEPTITLTLPTSIEVGNKIIPQINVKRQDGTTPIENAKVHFFVEDSLSLVSLGSQDTNADGDASAPSPYLVSEEQSEQDVTFIFFIRGKSL